MSKTRACSINAREERFKGNAWGHVFYLVVVESDMTVVFKRFLDMHMYIIWRDMDRIKAEEIILTWHYVWHRYCFAKKTLLFVMCYVPCLSRI